MKNDWLFVYLKFKFDQAFYILPGAPISHPLSTTRIWTWFLLFTPLSTLPWNCTLRIIIVQYIYIGGMNEWIQETQIIYIKSIWKCEARPGLVRARDSKSSLLGNWKRPTTLVQETALCLSFGKRETRKETGAQEEDGRDTDPAVTHPRSAGQSKIKLKNRGTAWGQWRVGGVPWEAGCWEWAERPRPPRRSTEPGLCRGRVAAWGTGASNSCACEYGDPVFINVSSYSVIGPLPSAPPLTLCASVKGE